MGFDPLRLILAQEKSILSTTPLVNNSLIIKNTPPGEYTPDITFSSDLLTLMKGITDLLPVEYYMVSVFIFPCQRCILIGFSRISRVSTSKTLPIPRTKFNLQHSQNRRSVID